MVSDHDHGLNVILRVWKLILSRYKITFKKANGNGQTSCGFMANNNTRNDMQCGVSTFTWDLKGIWGFYVQQMWQAMQHTNMPPHFVSSRPVVWGLSRQIKSILKRGNIKHYCKNRKVDFLLFSKEHTSVHFFLQACTYSLEVHTYPLNFEYFLLFVKEHASVHSWPMGTTIRLLELGQAINMKTIDNR